MKNREKQNSESEITLKMKILWILLSVVILSCAPASAQVTSRKCCDNEGNLINESKCTPDATGKSLLIALKCESKYVLDPNLYAEDNYNVTSNGSLHVFDFANVIQPGQ